MSYSHMLRRCIISTTIEFSLYATSTSITWTGLYYCFYFAGITTRAFIPLGSGLQSPLFHSGVLANLGFPVMSMSMVVVDGTMNGISNI